MCIHSFGVSINCIFHAVSTIRNYYVVLLIVKISNFLQSQINIHNLICSIVINIRRPNGQEGFVPRNYVKEVEPAVIKNVTKKKVIKPVKVKLRKKRTETQRIPKTFKNVLQKIFLVAIIMYIYDM